MHGPNFGIKRMKGDQIRIYLLEINQMNDFFFFFNFLGTHVYKGQRGAVFVLYVFVKE